MKIRISIKFIIIQFFFLGTFFSNNSFSQTLSTNNKSKSAVKSNKEAILNTPSCDELIHYRNVDLVKQFADFIKEYSRKYKQANDAIENMQEIKLNLLQERGWDELMSTGVATSGVGVTTAQIASIIKTYSDLILDIAEMFPPERLAVTAVKWTKLTAEKTYRIITTGQDLKEIVNGHVRVTVAKDILKDGYYRKNYCGSI